MSEYAKNEKDPEKLEVRQDDVPSLDSITWSKRLLNWGVEARGILPVPPEERTDRQFSKIFFIWFSSN